LISPRLAVKNAVFNRRTTRIFNWLTWLSGEATFITQQSSSPRIRGFCLSQLPPKTVSELLANWHAGDDEALRAAVPLVYEELRRVAHHYLRNERPGHTLQSTALVHEAYLRLEKQGAALFQNREHFLAVCAQLMRQILVDYARARNAGKRDGGFRLELDDALAFKTRSVDMVALDDALKELAKLDQQQSRIVELRFFGGLSIEETSRALNLSPMTVKRHWATARLWLRHQMSKAAEA
jgi:RNA polymerase sigma factor (TIGR02999 family)